MAFSDYKVAVVTGASAGMGKAIVERLCKEGLQVHAIARRPLDDLARKTGCIPHSLDITDTAALEKVLQPLSVDLLVNNAGTNRAGSLAQNARRDIDDLVQLTLSALLHAVRLVLPGMIARNRGHIVNVGSMSGLYHHDGNATYSATKAAVHALTGQIRLDVHGKRIRVTEICPGRTETEIFGIVVGDAAEAKKKFFDGYETLSPVDIADAVAYAVSAPSRVNIGTIEILPTFQVTGGLRYAKAE